MKKAMYPVVLIGVVFAVVACSGARNATRQPETTDEEASLVLNGDGGSAHLDSSRNDAASDAGAEPSPYAPNTSQIESDLGALDADLADFDAELNEGSSELGRTEVTPGE